jgi:hypothetical protein
VKKAAVEPFQRQDLLVKHVYGGDDKEKIARAYAAERGITEGDVCALTALELAPTFQHYKTDMLIRPRPCLTIYHYRIDPDFGWMHARMQTWFPFYVHVGINGREWLSRRMDREGLRYFRQENCFPWVEDIPRAQQLFQEQLAANWTERLQPFAQRLNPLHEEIFGNYPTQYYWSAFQCEWATDILGSRQFHRRTHHRFQKPRQRRPGQISHQRQLPEWIRQGQHARGRRIPRRNIDPTRRGLQILPAHRRRRRGRLTVAPDAAWRG